MAAGSPNQAFERFLNSLPPDVVASFNSHQLQAMSLAMQTQPRKHSVDFRITLPVLWKKFYLVLLIGAERRTAERRRVERQQHPLWTLGNVSLIMILIGLGLLAALGISQLRGASSVLLQPEEIRQTSPVVIPFVDNETDCVNSGRSWENDECIDYIHDRRF